jgi:hypothetical protein
MLENSYVPNNNVDRQIFYCVGTGGTAGGWQTWQKPEGRTIAHMVVIGGGAGGGGGASGGLTRSGGGGGSSSPVAIYMFPLILLPDTLYIYVGGKGSGGAATLGGTAGGVTYICVYPSFSSPLNSVLAFSGNTSNGGGGGTTAAATGGAAPGAFSIASSSPKYLNLGILRSLAGHGGSTGSTGGSGGSSYLQTGVIVSGGASGAGTTGNVAGGPVTPSNTSIGGPWQTLNGGVAGTTGVGQEGFTNAKPIFFTGGSGGGSSGGGTGAAGGDGSYGSGGGGGGAGATTGGAGGNGGDGLVIITSY